MKKRMKKQARLKDLFDETECEPKVKSEPVEAVVKSEPIVPAPSMPSTSLKSNKLSLACVPSTSRARVVFEPLVVIKNEHSFMNSLSSSRGSKNGGKPNFKKFRKIPPRTCGGNHRSNESKVFKSFKNEPFDVNSQFEMFMTNPATTQTSRKKK